ncbi:hypothetical protein D3C72_1872690 [compost metagenome]
MPSVLLARPSSASRALLSAVDRAWRSLSAKVPLPAWTTRVRTSCRAVVTESRMFASWPRLVFAVLRFRPYVLFMLCVCATPIDRDADSGSSAGLRNLRPLPTCSTRRFMSDS